MSTESSSTESSEATGDDKKVEKIMQVDGCDSASESGDDDTVDALIQVDGAGDDNEDTESLGVDPGEDGDSEFSAEDLRGRADKTSKICPLCKEEMKFSKTYHFATTHFRPRLQRDLPRQKPFLCPDCGETQQHKINLWSHYLGRAHKHLDEWLEEYLAAPEPKPDWCDPTPVNPKSYRRQVTSSSSSGVFSSPGSPLVSSETVKASASKEWFCDLCHGNVPQRPEIHFASLHFKEKLKAMLPTQSPFVCPDISCGAEHKHFLNLSTHFLTQHGYLKLWLGEKGIAYEAPTKKKPGRQLSSQSMLVDVKDAMEHMETNVLGKHCLSSSESEADTNDDDGREQLLDQPVHSSLLQRSLGFLTVKTEPEESSEQSAKKKRVKRQLDFDLVDIVQTLRDSNANEEYLHTREPPTSRVMTSSLMPGDCAPPHSWVCDGRLLILEDNLHQDNIKIFKDQWRRGQPIMVANVSNKLDMNLWSPDAFNKEFGDLKHDIINCKTHKKIPQVPMKWFWDGFENLKDRLLDNQGMPMLLKLKDWPTEDDFAQYFPKRFADLMSHLPLSDYTSRQGRYNLASFMPDFFLQPDLGPKMYIAYGSPLYPEYGSTNLHMDMSDAVNLMVYVGIPQDGNNDETVREGLKAVDEAGCDMAMKKRVREEGVRVGALWHIFHPRDADKIRDFLNKVSMEKGHKLEPHNDPIHDQGVYLTSHLRHRLFKEYGVEGYAIAQCEGDTVFIPAGAPHQVQLQQSINISTC